MILGVSLTDLTLVAFTVILVVSLNVVAGMARHMVFCQASFYGAGAYAVAVLSVNLGWSFWPCMGASVVVAGACGLLVGIPVLRVSGLYFAMLTWGIAIVAQGLASTLAITGGNQGVGPTPIPNVGGGLELFSPISFAAAAWVAVILSVVVVALLSRSHAGWAMRAMGEDTRAAQVIGATSWYVLLAFVVSAAFAGLAGGLFAYFIVQVYSGSFDVSLSIILVVALLVGGIGSIVGSLVGALIVSVLQFLLQPYPNIAQLVLGLFLVAVVALQPNGLVSARREKLVFRRVLPGRKRPHARQPVGQPVGAAPEFRMGSIGSEQIALTEREPSLLEVAGVSKSFGGLKALSAVTLSIGSGECVGVIGPNGAGKSTLLDIISGFTTPTSGSVRLNGRELLKVRPARRIRYGLFRTFQTPRVFAQETVYENVLLGSFSWNRKPLLDKVTRRSRAGDVRNDVWEILALLDLEQHSLTFATDLSYGQQKILEIARGLAAKPQFLLLDEPLSGLDPGEAEHMIAVLQGVTRLGVGVMLIEHNLGAVARTCQRVMVLHHGEEITTGRVDDVFHSERVRRAYFGPQVALQG